MTKQDSEMQIYGRVSRLFGDAVCNIQYYLIKTGLLSWVWYYLVKHNFLLGNTSFIKHFLNMQHTNLFVLKDTEFTYTIAICSNFNATNFINCEPKHA